MPRCNNTSKYWEALMYPDSVNPRVFDIMESMRGSTDFMISPFHNRDLKKDGKLKEPHKHVHLYYANQVSYNRYLEDCDLLGLKCAPLEEARIGKIDKARLYMCHLTKQAILDGKVKYDPEDCIFIGEYQLDDYYKLIKAYEEDQSDDIEILSQIFQYIKDSKCVLYCDLIDYLVNNNILWYRFATKNGNAQTILAYQKSLAVKEGLFIKGQGLT